MENDREDIKERYSRITLDLTTERNDEEIDISGNYISVVKCSGDEDSTYIKLNHRNARPLYLKEFKMVSGNFSKIYLSNAAKTKSSLILYIGTNVCIDTAGASGFEKGDITGSTTAALVYALKWDCSVLAGKTLIMTNTGAANGMWFWIQGYIGSRAVTLGMVNVGASSIKKMSIPELYEEIRVSVLWIGAATTYTIGYIGSTEYAGETITIPEDTVHFSGDSGVMALAVRNDAISALAGADGDYAPLQVSALGSVYVKEENTPPAVGALIAGTVSFDIADGETGFASQAVTKGVTVVVNDMGDATWVVIGTTGTPTVGVKLTAAGQGIENLPVSNVNIILMDTDASAGNDVTVAYIGV